MCYAKIARRAGAREPSQSSLRPARHHAIFSNFTSRRGSFGLGPGPRFLFIGKDGIFRRKAETRCTMSDRDQVRGAEQGER